MNDILDARGIRKVFQKDQSEIPVLGGVDILIRAGETVAIMGSSGAGKSTLLHILGTLDEPSAGEIFFGPQKVSLSKMKPAELARFRNKSLGFIFQFHYLLPEFSALENVMMPLLIGGVS